MLSIEEYISRRKKEDKLNEFDLEARTQNMKVCVDYVFEYFTNYLNITEVEERTVLHDGKLDKYRKLMSEYEPEVREWAVKIYNDYGKYVNRYVGNIVKENEFFFLFNSDSEFRSASYECYSKLIKRLPFLKDQTEMLFQYIKDYHRVESQKMFKCGIKAINEEMNSWIEETWAKHNVNMLAFTFDYTSKFFDHEDMWPATHRKKSTESWRKYDYDYKQKSNLFNIDSLYRRMPKKSFTRGRKQEFEVMFMYFWVHDLEGDDEGYWNKYLESVLPKLNSGD